MGDEPRTTEYAKKGHRRSPNQMKISQGLSYSAKTSPLAISPLRRRHSGGLPPCVHSSLLLSRHCDQTMSTLWSPQHSPVSPHFPPHLASSSSITTTHFQLGGSPSGETNSFIPSGLALVLLQCRDYDVSIPRGRWMKPTLSLPPSLDCRI